MNMADKYTTLQALKETGVVAVIRADKAEDLVDVGRALREGGVKFIEITMTVPGALGVIEKASTALQTDDVYIGAGTVVLPEMARRIAAGDEAGARRAQDQAIELTLLLAVPCVVAFLVVPELITRALFGRGAFTAADAFASARTLADYALGLIPFVLIRTVVATFFARGDTATPVFASLTAVAVNVGLKIILAMTTALAQVGLALATSVGAWINLALVVWFARRARLFEFDQTLQRSLVKLAVAGAVLALAIFAAEQPITAHFAAWTSWREEATLAALAALGAVVYGACVLVLFGARGLQALRKRRGAPLPEGD